MVEEIQGGTIFNQVKIENTYSDDCEKETHRKVDIIFDGLSLMQKCNFEGKKNMLLPSKNISVVDCNIVIVCPNIFFTHVKFSLLCEANYPLT